MTYYDTPFPILVPMSCNRCGNDAPAENTLCYGCVREAFPELAQDVSALEKDVALWTDAFLAARLRVDAVEFPSQAHRNVMVWESLRRKKRPSSVEDESAPSHEGGTQSEMHSSRSTQEGSAGVTLGSKSGASSGAGERSMWERLNAPVAPRLINQIDRSFARVIPYLIAGGLFALIAAIYQRHQENEFIEIAKGFFFPLGSEPGTRWRAVPLQGSPDHFRCVYYVPPMDPTYGKRMGCYLFDKHTRRMVGGPIDIRDHPMD